jgi:hypothetical protein
MVRHTRKDCVLPAYTNAEASVLHASTMTRGEHGICCALSFLSFYSVTYFRLRWLILFSINEYHVSKYHSCKPNILLTLTSERE